MSDKKPKKKKSKARVIVEWSLTIVFGALFLFAAIAQIDGFVHRDENYGQTIRFGWGSFVVLTSSMEPEYPVNSAIITHKDDPKSIFDAYNRGEKIDITFFNNAYYVTDPPTGEGMEIYTERVTKQAVFTHRLFFAKERTDVKVGDGHYLFYVKGINTEGVDWKERQYQLFTEKELLGVVKVNSPFLGGVFSFMSSPWGLLIFLLVPAGYLVVVSVLDIFKTIKEPEEPRAALPTPEGGSGEAKADPLAGLTPEEKSKLMQEMLDEMMKGGKK